MIPRPLLLGGMMGVGKTTVGRRVAELASVPFVDLDAEIAACEDLAETSHI